MARIASRHIETLFPPKNVVSMIADSERWVADNAPALRRKIRSHGGIHLSGIPCNGAENFERLMLTLFPTLSGYIGGTSPREVIHNKIMTATRTPKDWSIIPHQEMAYTSHPPDVIAFFCAQPASVGGASTITEMRRAAKDLDPTIVDRLLHHGVQLRRTLPSVPRMHLKPGIQKPWEEVFGSDSRSEAEDVAQQKGWRIDWCGEDMVLWQEIVPAFRTHRVTGDMIWCNQVHFFNPATMVAWAEKDGRTRDATELREAMAKHPELMDRMYLGNGEPVSDADALHVLGVLQRHETSLELQANDILILDNLYVAHGRSAFRGTRDVQVALAHWQDAEEFS